MKKLSEIGDKCFLDPVPVSSKLNSHLHYVRLYHATETGESPTSDTDIEITVLTRNERRKFVRGSIKRFLVGHMLEWRLKCELSTALDEFCEEQGL